MWNFIAVPSGSVKILGCVCLAPFGVWFFGDLAVIRAESLLQQYQPPFRGFVRKEVQAMLLWYLIIIIVISAPTLTIAKCDDAQQIYACIANEFEANRNGRDHINTKDIKRKYNELEDKIPWIARSLLGLNADMVVREAGKRCGIHNGKYTRKDIMACAAKHQDEICPYLDKILEIVGCDVTLPTIPPVALKRNLGSSLLMGQIMNVGDYLRSDNGMYTLILEAEAQLGLYMVNDKQHENAIWKTPAWSPTSKAYAVVKTDGNFELIEVGSGKVLWETKTRRRDGEFYLKLQNDRDLVLYSEKGALWDAHTGVEKDEL